MRRVLVVEGSTIATGSWAPEPFTYLVLLPSCLMLAGNALHGEVIELLDCLARIHRWLWTNCHVHTFSMDMIIIGHQNWRCPISFFLNSDVDCGIRGLVFPRLYRHHDANDGNWRARWACFLAELWWRLSTCTYIIIYIHNYIIYIYYIKLYRILCCISWHFILILS